MKIRAHSHLSLKKHFKYLLPSSNLERRLRLRPTADLVIIKMPTFFYIFFFFGGCFVCWSYGIFILKKIVKELFR